MMLNLLLHQGWIGAFGQVIAGDFIMFYSTGEIYRSNPTLIYDFDTQNQTQQALVAPSVLPGYNPYMNPPFVAPFFSLLTLYFPTLGINSLDLPGNIIRYFYQYIY